MTTSASLFQSTCPLILASASPRRRELLGLLGITFSVRAARGAEPAPVSGEAPADYCTRAAVAKAEAVYREEAVPDRPSVILSADTVVVVSEPAGPVILGKPRTPDEALGMLLRLNDRKHEVHTGCCLLWISPGDTPCRREIFHDRAEVTFASWPEAVLRAYVATGESMDKAGAYAIQGKGSFLSSRLEGLWSTVVGLPLSLVTQRLLQGGALRAVVQNN